MQLLRAARVVCTNPYLWITSIGSSSRWARFFLPSQPFGEKPGLLATVATATLLIVY